MNFSHWAQIIVPTWWLSSTASVLIAEYFSLRNKDMVQFNWLNEPCVKHGNSLIALHGTPLSYYKFHQLWYSSDYWHQNIFKKSINSLQWTMLESHVFYFDQNQIIRILFYYIAFDKN